MDIVAKLIHTAGRREAPPGEAYRQTLAAATAAWHAKVRGRRQRRLVGWVAASLVLTVTVGVVVGNLMPAPASAPVARMDRIIGTAEMRTAPDGPWTTLRNENRDLLAGSLLRTQPGSRAGILLVGGVSLRLAESTEIVIDAADQIRMVSGKLYLDTGSRRGDVGRIKVITEAGVATDVGTQFEVIYRDATYRLRVREGRVELARGAELLDSAAGQQFTIDAAGEIRRSRIALDDPDWQWTESLAPAPDIDGKPVSVLLEWVARETGKPVRFEEAALEQKAARTILHGSIRHLAPLEALDVMLATTDFDYRILEEGTILIRSKTAR